MAKPKKNLQLVVRLIVVVVVVFLCPFCSMLCMVNCIKQYHQIFAFLDVHKFSIKIREKMAIRAYKLTENYRHLPPQTKKKQQATFG